MSQRRSPRILRDGLALPNRDDGPPFCPVSLQDWQRHFNTPLSAITFGLEQIIEDLNNRAFLAQMLIASVTATFVSHIFLGDNPAFVIPSIEYFSGILYLLVIPTAGACSSGWCRFPKMHFDLAGQY